MARRLLVLGIGLLLPASFLAAGEATPPRKSASAVPDGVRVLRDLEYVEGGHERNRLDLYLPEKASCPMPLVVWIHGGGWINGSKNGPPALPLTAHGYAVASINYRLSQHATFPAQIHDCKAAIRWLRAHAGQYGFDGSRIGARGASAGGHLVAMLGTAGGAKDLEGPGGNLDQSSRVQAVVDYYGPANFLTLAARPNRTQFLGGDPQTNRDKAARASPVTYVSRDAPPFLILHGDKDTRVPLSQSIELAEALKKADVEVTLVTVPGGEHGGAVYTGPDNMKRVQEFLDRTLRDKK